MISNIYANNILNTLCGRTSLDQPTSLYIGVCADEPRASDGAINGEPTAPSYGRTLVGGKGQQNYFGAASAGKITNITEIQFKTARTKWGFMKYFFLSNSSTGPAIMWGDLRDPENNHGVQINEHTVPTFYEGELTISLDVPLSEDTTPSEGE